jgi:hypothetical protein
LQLTEHQAKPLFWVSPDLEKFETLCLEFLLYDAQVELAGNFRHDGFVGFKINGEVKSF